MLARGRGVLIGQAQRKQCDVIAQVARGALECCALDPLEQLRPRSSLPPVKLQSHSWHPARDRLA
jgi:hypothetical protein